MKCINSIPTEKIVRAGSKMYTIYACTHSLSAFVGEVEISKGVTDIATNTKLVAIGVPSVKGGKVILIGKKGHASTITSQQDLNFGWRVAFNKDVLLVCSNSSAYWYENSSKRVIPTSLMITTVSRFGKGFLVGDRYGKVAYISSSGTEIIGDVKEEIVSMDSNSKRTSVLMCTPSRVYEVTNRGITPIVTGDVDNTVWYDARYLPTGEIFICESKANTKDDRYTIVVYDKPKCKPRIVAHFPVIVKCTISRGSMPIYVGIACFENENTGGLYKV